jgi:hypothetical protein
LLGPPETKSSTSVRVSTEHKSCFTAFDGTSVPIDNRSYLLYGYTLLPGGQQIPTRFEIDTRKPTLLCGTWLWHVNRRWYIPFEPEVLGLIGVTPQGARPFRWTTNVPIQTIEQPPYLEGQTLHGLTPATTSEPRAQSKSADSVGGGDLVSMSLDIQEKVLWSCRARNVKYAAGAGRGALFITTRRVLFCPSTVDRAAGAEPLAIGIREVTDVGCKHIGDPQSASGRKTALRLVLVHGREEIFEVDGVTGAIERFAKAIHPVR